MNGGLVDLCREPDARIQITVYRAKEKREIDDHGDRRFNRENQLDPQTSPAPTIDIYRTTIKMRRPFIIFFSVSEIYIRSEKKLINIS